MTIRKRSGGPGEERPRPRIKSSHEKVAPARRASSAHSPAAAPKARPLRAASASGSARSTGAGDARERARGPRRARSGAGGGGGTGASAKGGDVKPDANGAWSAASSSARETASAIAMAALDKKAVGLQILDVAGRVDYADFLVLMTGRSDRHAQALAQGIEEAMKARGSRPIAVEGLPHGSWVLMDFGDVVVHVFTSEARELYDIDGLWLDARRLPVPGGVTEEAP